MLRLEGQGVGEGLFPLLHGLPRQAVNEVQTHVREFYASGRRPQPPCTCRYVWMGPRPGETDVVRGLDPPREMRLKPACRSSSQGLPVPGTVAALPA